MEKMRGLIIWEDGHASLEEMALPEISEYQALVKVTAGALCGTDMKIIHNNLKGFADYPTILGHEGVGRIVKTGSKVRNFEIGDKVVLPYIFNPIGSYYSTWGAFAEYSVIGDTDAMLADGHTMDDGTLAEFNFAQRKIPDTFDDVAATMIVTFREVYSTMKRLCFRKGQNLVIYGAGPVGMTFLRMAKYMGLGPVVCVDRHDEKLDFAKKQGADYVLNDKKADVPSEIRKLFPEGADILLDAAGVPELINQNLRLVKDYGDVCIYGVTPKNEVLMNWQNAPFSFNLRFAQWPSKKEEAAVHDEIIEMMKNGVLNGMDYISDVFEFKDSVEAVEFFKAKKNTKKVAIRF